MRYEPAAAIPKAAGCQTGTRALQDAIAAAYPELEAKSARYGCFNRRRMSGSVRWSLHAEGRALDIGVGDDDSEIGWHLACRLVEHRMTYGTMRVMWDRHIWSIEKPDQWRRLKASTQQHLDHIHVEQFWRAALRPRSTAAAYERALLQGR